MTYLDLMRKYRGRLTDATARELSEAGHEARARTGTRSAAIKAIYKARADYKREIKTYIQNG